VTDAIVPGPPPATGAAGPRGATPGDEVLDRLEAQLPRLVRLATRLVRDPDVAEDLAQETLIAAWRNADRLRSPDALWSWLRRTLLNRVIDRSRVHRDELDIEDVEADWRDDHFTVQPERVLEIAELREDLEDALARLPAIYRLPVVLHDALGWTAGEIAASMDAGLPATKQRLRRGRMMLVSALAEDDARRRASLAQPMRCWRARRHVSAYLDGELDAATVVAVEGHLAACPTCPPLYAALVGVRARLEGLRDPDSVVEERVAGRVRAHLGEHVHGAAAGPADHAHAPG
jgi:RNA polymerase sigma-70 factor (ECF subfamily)